MNLKDKENNREYKWYLEPLNGQTNLAISIQLPEENFCQPACEDGQSHNLWQCSFQMARSFWESKENSGLHFNIYVQEKNGKIRKVNFLFRRKRKSQIKTAI